MSIWAGPLSYLYQGITDVKNDLFKKNALKIHQVPIPVISIGNLTVGGTGKTPFTDYTIKYFLNQKKRVGVVSRAYKARAKKPVKVDIHQSQASRFFGDEPLWLAQENPQASVFVGASKWQIAEWAVQQQKLDLLIVDDGFQHRKLHRDLNILILDATETWENYRVLPMGRAREKFSNIERADLVVISKCNLAEPEMLKKIREQIPAEKQIVETGYRISQFRNFHSGEIRKRNDFAGTGALLFCSIAKPQIFKKSLQDVFASLEILPFSDHHSYTSEDVESILGKMKKHGLEHLCCTEKDAVKLKSLWPAQVDLWVSELEIEILDNKERLHEIYNRFCP